MGLCLCSHLFEEVDEQMEEKYRLRQQMDVVRNRLQGKKLPVIWLRGAPGTGVHSHACNIAERFGYAHIHLPSPVPDGVRPTDGGIMNYIQEHLVAVGDTKGYLFTGFPQNEHQLKRFWKEINANEPAAEVFLRIEATILDRLAISAP